MADAYICRGGQFEFKTFGTIKVKANSGATVTCAKDGQSYGSIVPVGSKFVEFKAELGTWTITSTFNGKVKDKEIEVENINNIYEVDLYTEVGSIKVIANNGTVVNCKKGLESFDKTVLEEGYVQFDNLELGEWTITSTYKGKTNKKSVDVSEDGQVYEANHYIYFGSIKVLAHPNTSITVKKGEESYTQSVGAGATFILFQLLEFGTWNITSTYKGKTKTGNINIQSETEVYQIDHNINIANIRVLSHQGTVVKCQKGSETYNLTTKATGYVDFNNLDFGNWTITSTYKTKTKTGTVNLQILDNLYQLDHRINVANIRVNAYEGTVVKCVMGKQSFNQTVSSSGFVTFNNLDFGTWTITSTKYGINKSEQITLSILNNIYQLNHNIEVPIKLYGISINCSVSDPTTAVSYTSDAVGFTPLSVNLSNGVCNYGSWDKNTIIRDLFGIRPCLVKDGVRTKYLNPDNYAQDINGNPVDITSGNAGDVMIEFKKCWYRYSKSENILKFEVSTTYQEGFVTTAFTSEDGNGRDVDYFYYSAYEGYVDENNKLRSLSGKVLSMNNGGYPSFINYAANNCSGGTIECFGKRMYILGLLMLVTKSRDMQAKIGYGRSKDNTFGINSGTMNTNGLFFGKNDFSTGVKCFGIENMWGNMWTLMAGLITTDENFTIGIKLYAPYYSKTSITQYYKTSSNITQAKQNTYYPTSFKPIIDGSIIISDVYQNDYTVGWTDNIFISDTSYNIPILTPNWNRSGLSNGPFGYFLGNNAHSDRSDGFTGSRLVIA